MSGGILGDMFDLNCDGEIDMLEQGVELMYLESLLKENDTEGESDIIF